MFLDARVLPSRTTRRYDVCIVGAGPAGITLARELSGRGHRIALLEAGGLEFDEQEQKLYQGTTEGQRYSLVDSRLRMFGGTSGHWGGLCRPLDPADFAGTPELGVPGWPLAAADLAPFYRGAHDVLQLGRFDYDRPPQHLSEPILDSDRVATQYFRFSPPTRFGAVYRDEVRRAGDVEALLHATVTRLGTVAGSDRVTEASVTAAATELSVEASVFVLAAGGIENARLLLLSDDVRTRGLGNRHDLVGRFFCEHPHVYAHDEIVGVGRTALASVYGSRVAARGVQMRPVLVAPPAVRRREGMLNASVSLNPLPTQEVPFLTSSVSRLVEMGRGVDAQPLGLVVRSEQQPRWSNRVRLTGRRDALGLRRVHLRWRLSDRDRRTVRRTLELIARGLGRHGLGRVRLPATEGWPDEAWSQLMVRGGNHHMGTTRMGPTPKRGVVDEDCRVHELDNLYIAGSSVFPSVGYANPTLTIVALALRLADHLHARLRG